MHSSTRMKKAPAIARLHELGQSVWLDFIDRELLTSGKLGRLIKERGRKPLLVAADLQRPAAIDQLHVLGEQLGIPVYSDRTIKDPVKVCQQAV